MTLLQPLPLQTALPGLHQAKVSIIGTETARQRDIAQGLDKEQGCLNPGCSKCLLALRLSCPSRLTPGTQTITQSRRSVIEMQSHIKACTRHRAPSRRQQGCTSFKAVTYTDAAFGTTVVAEDHIQCIYMACTAQDMQFRLCRAQGGGGVSEVCHTWCCDNCIFCTGRWAL